MVAEADESDRSFLQAVAVDRRRHEHRSRAHGGVRHRSIGSSRRSSISPTACRSTARSSPASTTRRCAALLPRLDAPGHHLRVRRRTPTCAAIDAVTDGRLRPLPGALSRPRRARRRPATGDLALDVPGRHNLQNALAAIAVGLELGVPFDRIAAALAEFRGAERRYQVRGTVARRHGRRRLRPSSDRDRRGAARGARRAPDAARRGLSAAPLHAHARSARRLRSGARRSPTSSCSPTSTPAGEAPIPGHHARRAGGGGARPRARSCASCRRSTTCRRRVARLARDGDLVVTLGAGSIGARRRSHSRGAVGAGGRSHEPREPPARVAAVGRRRVRRRPTAGSGGPMCGPGRAAPGGRRSAPALRWGAAVAAGSPAAARGWRRRRCARRAMQRQIASSSAATRGCRLAKSKRSLDGIARREHPPRRLRRVPPRGCWTRRGSPTSRCRARAAVDGRAARRRARADGDRAARPAALPRRRDRRHHRRVRSAVPRVRPADRRRPRRAAAPTASGRRSGAGRSWSGAFLDALDARAGPAPARCRRSTSRPRTTSWCCSTTTRRWLHLGDSAVRRAARQRTSSWRRRCRSSSRRSTTWICGSTNACTCGRKRRHERRPR